MGSIDTVGLGTPIGVVGGILVRFAEISGVELRIDARSKIRLVLIGDRENRPRNTYLPCIPPRYWKFQSAISILTRDRRIYVSASPWGLQFHANRRGTVVKEKERRTVLRRWRSGTVLRARDRTWKSLLLKSHRWEVKCSVDVSINPVWKAPFERAAKCIAVIPDFRPCALTSFL